MLEGSRLPQADGIRRTQQRKSHTLFPNLHSFSNHLTTASNLLKSVQIPDILPADILPPNADFSFVACDWEEVYGGRTEAGSWSTEDQVAPEQRGQWEAVVTCFFIDTARNVMNYLAIIKGLLKDEGVWINVGPLLWHFENIADRERGEGGIELSLDEVKALARTMGFDLKVSQADKTRRHLLRSHAERVHDQNDVHGGSGEYAQVGIHSRFLMAVRSVADQSQVAFWTATKRKSA